MTPGNRRRARIAATAAVAALLIPAAPGIAAGSTGPGPGVGWIRVGHLSPKAAPVDIYFAKFGRQEKAVIRMASYGAVTPYSSLDPGMYTLSMRPANVAPSTMPTLSATISVSAATAYSLLVFANGTDGMLKGQVVTDDLTPPAAGNGRVRLVQGSSSISPVTVTGPNGMVIAKDAIYGATTPYMNVPQGSWPLQLAGSGAASPATLDVREGSVTTVLLTEMPGGGLRSEAIPDGAAVPTAPKLGVETGGGGTAQQSSGQLGWAVWLAGAVLVAGAFSAVARRRVRTR